MLISCARSPSLRGPSAVLFQSKPVRWSSSGLSSSPRVVAYKYLGHDIPYPAALRLQDEMTASRRKAKGARLENLLAEDLDIVLLLQHPPTYTAGRRLKGSDASEGERLRKLGAGYFETLRGGQTTFHGPGQLVGYPILDLRKMGLGVRNYVCTLERFLIDTCSKYGIQAARTQDTGVWVEDRKIAALGIQVRQHITSHGFALNANVDLEWYKHIVPCGLEGKSVTSVAAEVDRNQGGQRGTTVGDVIPDAMASFGVAFDCTVVPLESISINVDKEIDAFIHSETTNL